MQLLSSLLLRNGGTEQHPVGLWAQEPFCVPCVLVFFVQPPWPSLSSYWKVQTVASQGREGMESQGRRNQETAVKPCSRVLVSPQGTRIIIFLSCLADTEDPARLEKLTACFPQVHWPPAGLNQKVDDSDSLLPHYQPFRIMSMGWSHLSFWTISAKLLATHSRSSNTGLRVWAHCGPLYLAKQWNSSLLLLAELCLWDSI